MRAEPKSTKNANSGQATSDGKPSDNEDGAIEAQGRIFSFNINPRLDTIHHFFGDLGCI